MRVAVSIAWTAVLVLALPASGVAQPAAQSGCESILKAHGFLSRAQFQCNFGWYSREMMESARRCSQGMDEAQVRQLLASGMQTFDRNEQQKGHAAMCREVLANFPGMLRE
ncbi:MAG: hypothetical protein JOZ05_17175 [Acetobacteraceae bacterium]|nr:hypothetical protein [Acetobacteraceae bacterium]